MGCTAGCTTCSSGADVLSGFTIVRNALKLNFPIVATICSVLGACDEVVVNVGKSDDETREVIEGIGDSRIRIIENVWDMSKGDATLALQTQRAMDACQGSWGIYVQADEVLHECGAAILKQKVAECDTASRGGDTRKAQNYEGDVPLGRPTPGSGISTRLARMDPAASHLSRHPSGGG